MSMIEVTAMDLTNLMVTRLALILDMVLHLGKLTTANNGLSTTGNKDYFS